MKKSVLVAICAVPLLFGGIASVLFVAQGGFGGGHGRFDRAIGVLAMPGLFILEQVKLPAVVQRSDLLLVVWLPALVNLVVWAVLVFGAALFLKKRSPSLR